MYVRVCIYDIRSCAYVHVYACVIVANRMVHDIYAYFLSVADIGSVLEHLLTFNPLMFR